MHYLLLSVGATALDLQRSSTSLHLAVGECGELTNTRQTGLGLRKINNKALHRTLRLQRHGQVRRSSGTLRDSTEYLGGGIGFPG
jgi:hypothetical protein